MARPLTVRMSEKSHFSEAGANLRTSQRLIPNTRNQKIGCSMPAMK